MTTIDLIDRFAAMCFMRAFEDCCAQGVRTGELRGELHLATGQEGVAAGLLGSLQPGDWMVGTHRSHPMALAKGIDPYRLLAEIYEKGTGLCAGKGGHMHLFDREGRFSTTGIVGSSLSVALGHAYALRLEGGDALAIGITGDGGTNTGQFHEVMNMAALWTLPLILLVEDNGYGISVPASASVAAPGILARAQAYGIPAVDVDGTDVEAMASAFAALADQVRAGQGPGLLLAHCHRFAGHYEGDPDQYRTVAQHEEMRAIGDPISVARTRLLAGGLVTWPDLDRVEADQQARAAGILAQVRAAEPPEDAQAWTQVFSEETR